MKAIGYGVLATCLTFLFQATLINLDYSTQEEAKDVAKWAALLSCLVGLAVILIKW